MKQKLNFLIFAALFLIIMPLQFACNEEDEQLQQTCEFDPWSYDFNCNGKIDPDELGAVINDFETNKINEAEFKTFIELLISLKTTLTVSDNVSTLKSDFDKCAHDNNPKNDVIGNAEISVAVYYWATQEIPPWATEPISNRDISQLEYFWATQESLNCYVYYYLDGDGWVITPLQNRPGDSEEEAEGFVSYAAKAIAKGYIDETVVKDIFLKKNLPYLVFSKANLILTIFDAIWNGIEVTCPESIFHLVITNEESGLTAHTKSDTKFDAGYFEAAISIFQGDDTEVNHWMFKLFEWDHNTLTENEIAMAVFKGDQDGIMQHVPLGTSAMLIWDKQFYIDANHKTIYMKVYKNSYEDPNNFELYSEVHLTAENQ